MKSIVHILTIIFFFCFLSCSKPKSTLTGGGKGGNLFLKVMPVHHGQFVDSCIVYIKYGTSQAPANGVYDDSGDVVVVADTPFVTFGGLLPGQYYVFGVGFHTGYSPPNVRGGQHATLDKSEQTPLNTYQY